MPFWLWIQVGRRKHVFTVTWGALVSHGRYSWTVHVQWRCGLMSNYFDHLLSHRTVVWGVFSLLYYYLFVWLRISQWRKRIGAWKFASCSTTIRTGVLPFWWTLARVESRWRHYFRDELYRNRSGAVGIGRCGLVGIWNWGWQHNIRPYGGIFVLQACWCTSLLFLIYLCMTYHHYSPWACFLLECHVFLIIWFHLVMFCAK